MKSFTPFSAAVGVAFLLLATGCVTPEHRMNVAESRDDTRRAEFEHCRDQGGANCDAILNQPVNSTGTQRDSVREQERRQAYNRCVERGGSNCGDLLHRDYP